MGKIIKYVKDNIEEYLADLKLEEFSYSKKNDKFYIQKSRIFAQQRTK